MSQSHDYKEGTAEELVPYLVEHPKRRFRLVPLISKASDGYRKSQMIQEGMFPALKGLPEIAFNDAQWHEDRSSHRE